MKELIQALINQGIITVTDIQRMTTLELLLTVIERVNELHGLTKEGLEAVQRLLDKGVQEEVVAQLDKWLQDGTFDTLINQTALKQVNGRIDETNAQLSLVTGIISGFVNVKSFICDDGRLVQGDGIHDDTSGIQRALDTCVNIYFPKGVYSVTSKNGENALTIKSGTKIYGGGIDNTIIKVANTMDTVFSDGGIRCENVSIDDIFIDCNKLANTGCDFSSVGAPYCNFKNVFVKNSNGVAFKYYGWVTTFFNVRSMNCDTGFLIAKKDDAQALSTSLTFNSCYANNCKIGYDIGRIAYTTMNSCACDGADLGYKLYYIEGMSLNSCGSEQTRKPFHMTYKSYGLTVNDFHARNCGSETSADTVDALFEVDRGLVTFNNIDIENFTANPRYYAKKFKLNRTNDGKIVINDQRIGFNDVECENVESIILPLSLTIVDRGSDGFSTIHELETLSSLNYKEFLGRHNLKLSDGTYSLEDNIEIKMLDGTGIVRISGNENDRNAVKIDLNEFSFIMKNCQVKVLFENLTFTNNSSNTQMKYASMFKLNNCSNIIFKNCEFKNNGVYGGVARLNYSNVVIDNSNVTGETWSGCDNSGKLWLLNTNDSELKLIRSGKPTIDDGYFDRGMWFNDNSLISSNFTGYINLTSGKGGNWREIGMINN